MTREEAIKILSMYDVNGQWHDADGYPYDANTQANAFDMAIEALQAEYEDYEHATLVDIKEPLKVSVVRCYDCRWWNSETKGCKRNPSVEAWHKDDFCNYGKRWSNAID